MNRILIEAFDNCRLRQASIERKLRPRGIDGIAVDDDYWALEWQRLDRIACKCYERIFFKLEAAEVLARVVEKVGSGIKPAASGEPELVIDPEDMVLLATALRRYREATRETQ